MPRPLRIEFENAWYHVMNRGANRQAIFKSNTHRNLFYTLLSEISDRFKVEIHSFCLMSNHYHLLIKTPYANLARAMRHLDGLYTQRFNKICHRDGPLFRGRYKAILVDSDQYLLQVSRYIHLNPVVANICNDPIDYKWSSYLSYINKKLAINWLKTNEILNRMQSDNNALAYVAFINHGIDQETNRFYNKRRLSSIYGTKKFIETHLNSLDSTYTQIVSPDINHTKALPNAHNTLEIVIEYFNITMAELHESVVGKKNLPKMIAIYFLSQHCQLKHKDISKIFTSLKETSIPAQIIRLKNLFATSMNIRKYILDLSNRLAAR